MSEISFSAQIIPDGADIGATCEKYGINKDTQVRASDGVVTIKGAPEGFDINNISWEMLPDPPEDVILLRDGDWSGDFPVSDEVVRRIVRVLQLFAKKEYPNLK